jgi:hypothetical protein
VAQPLSEISRISTPITHMGHAPHPPQLIVWEDRNKTGVSFVLSRKSSVGVPNLKVGEKNDAPPEYRRLR